jgi:hypothetical protein
MTIVKASSSMTPEQKAQYITTLEAEVEKRRAQFQVDQTIVNLESEVKYLENQMDEWEPEGSDGP